MRLLVVTRHPPLPDWDGSGSYLFSLLSYFARRGVLIEIAWSDPPKEWLRPQPVRLPAALTDIFSLQMPGSLALGRWRWMRWGSHKARILHLLRQVFHLPRASGPTGLSTAKTENFRWERLPSSGELRFFSERIRAFKPDVVLANYCWLTPALENARLHHTAVLAHDVASQRFARLNPDGLVRGATLDRFRPERESALLAKAQTILAITEEDAATFRSWLPHSNTVLTPMAAVSPSPGRRVPIPDRCLFVGGMNEPNREGLAWLLDEIWPRVRALHPSATLHIFGHIVRAVVNPPDGVTLRGHVADLAEAYEESAIALIPLLRGSGMKIKSVEAASHGKACVSTTVGLQGLAAFTSHVIEANDTETFVAGIRRLLADRGFAESLGRSLQRTAEIVLSPETSYAPAFTALFPHRATAARARALLASSPVAPTVSVVMPVYNAARYLRTAVNSILAQTWRDFELIAVDDGSTDESKAILESLAAHDSRIIIHSRPNTGIVGALNDGLALARGEFIARMDADDEAASTRFATQLARLRLETGIVALGSAVTFMDAAGHPVKAFPRPLEHVAIERALLAGDGGAMIHPAVTFRTSALRQAGGYRQQANYVEDFDLFLRLARIGKLANLPTFELRYRVHPKSINFTKNSGRHAVKLAILREAWEARGLEFDPTRFADSFSRYADEARHHREWAVTSLAYGVRSVAVAHGWQTVRLRPFEPASWRALKYALTAPLPRPDHCHQP